MGTLSQCHRSKKDRTGNYCATCLWGAVDSSLASQLPVPSQHTCPCLWWKRLLLLRGDQLCPHGTVPVVGVIQEIVLA